MLYAGLIEGATAQQREQIDDALAEPDPAWERQRRLMLVQQAGGEVIVA